MFVLCLCVTCIACFFMTCTMQVIVMDFTWKSSIDREPLKFLRPNPYYMGIVRMIIEEQKVPFLFAIHIRLGCFIMHIQYFRSFSFPVKSC